ncbi:flagellar hook-length control protein FliK [Pseudodesulfovibrio senegalensis]|uniref:Flagellar hook-length control protein-like C-terminal domain-containing protein n=1 Tax=Pseudodesulfovibrio senegalensis TaxID=1721087 RepID=A0A6N6N0I4_9BACT|nr:flagellar hook-length control protein FliK [Pseudodesulfovibrio senegalensis]KAB1438976.1 hypothetical protein F8A88_14735 [Pseudodesulfovibrio senegalensis]
MQNIPYLEDMNFPQSAPKLAKKVAGDARDAKDTFSELVEKQSNQQAPEADLNKAHRDELFDEIFEQHDALVDKELATAPVSTDSHMHEAAPEVASNSTPKTAEPLEPAEKSVHEEPETAPEDERMTEDDLEEMRDDLEEYGLSESEIQEIEEQINSEEGLTWGEFTQQLENRIKENSKVELSDDQQKELASFLGKLGFTEKESAKLMKQFMNGEGSEAMQAIAQKLETLPENKKLLLTKGEVESFAAAVNASEEFTADIKKLLGKEALPKDVKEAFSLIRQDMADNEAKNAKLVRAVGKTLSKVMGKELRESSAAAETGGTSDLWERVANEARTLMAEAETRNVRNENAHARHGAKHAENPVAQAAAETQNSKAAGENPGQTVRQVAKDQGEAAGQQAVNDRQQQNDNGRQQSANGQKDNPAGQSMNPARQSAQRDPGSNQPFMEKDAYNADNAKKAFTDKLRGDDGAAVRDASGVKAGNKAADAARTLIAEHAGHGTEAKAKAESAWEKISAPKVMKQVTDAAFKNLGQGKKQLTLNLKPVELGAVRVILQVDGKEVNATLRAENADAAKVISDNIEMLKQSLENQGLKVNKLDVQTGLADNSSQQNWHGEQQHNLAREREAMSRMRERMRNLRSADGNLARNMQNMNTTANTADQGLHVVA